MQGWLPLRLWGSFHSITWCAFMGFGILRHSDDAINLTSFRPTNTKIFFFPWQFRKPLIHLSFLMLGNGIFSTHVEVSRVLGGVSWTSSYGRRPIVRIHITMLNMWSELLGVCAVLLWETGWVCVSLVAGHSVHGCLHTLTGPLHHCTLCLWQLPAPPFSHNTFGLYSTLCFDCLAQTFSSAFLQSRYFSPHFISTG